jgi:NADH:ubiquinone oxidoreductase subunit E
MVREGEVFAAATSQTELRVLEPGKHVLRVCTGPSCSENGGEELAAAVANVLQTPPGETTPDGSITFEESPCLYMCALGPSVELDGRWAGRATPEAVRSLISRARSS